MFSLLGKQGLSRAHIYSMLSSTSSNLFYVARDFVYVLRDRQGIRDCRSLHMAFANSKYTFRTRPLLHQLLWRQGEITIRAKAQLNGQEV